MTAPDATDVGVSAASIQALLANAKRLGLTWNLRPGTVQLPVSGIVQVILDGDTDPIGVTSLIGSPSFGSRVMAILVPPGGVFLIGGLGGTTPRQLTNMEYVISSADLSLGAADASVPGLLVPLSTVGAALWEVHASLDIRETVVGTSAALMSLYVDGVAETSLIVYTMVATTDRAMASQTWSGSFAAGGDHTFEIQGHRSAAVGTQIITLLNSTMLVKTYE